MKIVIDTNVIVSGIFLMENRESFLGNALTENMK